jgi:hypothetical protein
MNVRVLALTALLVLPAACSSGPEARQHSPEENWARVMELSQVSDSHLFMASMAGTWDAEMTVWMGEGAPPTTSKGTLEQRAVLGGLFLEGRYVGEVSGIPFEGVSTLGFDNRTGEFVGTWIDSLSSAMQAMGSGTRGEDGVVRMHRTAIDIWGDETEVSEFLWLEGTDRMVFEMLEKRRGEQARLVMRIRYTRV